VAAIADIREELVERQRALRQRVDCIERAIEDGARRGEVSREELRRRHPVALELASADRHELELLGSALRRIEIREYDCCIACGGTIALERLEHFPYTVNCDRCSRGFGVAYWEHLRAQHVGLRRLAEGLGAALRDVVEGQRAGRHDAAAGVATRVIVEDLASLLPEHFALEEKGGYMTDVLSAAPRFQRRVGSLKREHAVLARQMAELAEHARAAEAPKEWEAVRGEASRFAEALLHHEREEGDLMRAAFADDLGSAG
jgi:DnaK suppressor protein